MRKKKKRRKKLPRSGSTRRRRLHDRCAGFAGCDAPRDVFPMVDDWPEMLGIVAGMDQKDSVIVVVMAVAYAWLILLVSLLALCFLLFIGRPRMLRILVGVDQKDSSAAISRPRSSSNAAVAWVCWVRWWMQFVLCPLRCRQARRQVLSVGSLRLLGRRARDPRSSSQPTWLVLRARRRQPWHVHGWFYGAEASSHGPASLRTIKIA